MDVRHRNGAVAELIAAAYFVSLGCELWWPNSGQSRSDFAIVKDGAFLKVQVKKATWSFAGNREYLAAKMINQAGSAYTPDSFDLLAVVDEDQRIWVVPFEAAIQHKILHFDKRGPLQGPTSKRTKFRPEKWLVSKGWKK